MRYFYKFLINFLKHQVLPSDSLYPESDKSDSTEISTVMQTSTPITLSSQTASWQLYGVQMHCPRVDQCFPNPCHSGGDCTDLWTTFHCSCQRPYLGRTCQYSMFI